MIKHVSISHDLIIRDFVKVYYLFDSIMCNSVASCALFCYLIKTIELNRTRFSNEIQQMSQGVNFNGIVFM